ncbi:LptF/LptG family permease [Candidatus Pelagibacter sp. HIMB1495]|uniref:LptF/LptG family permease n=1 Tax=unclassified Candidatus Pelagibacter TaxID=2647897 RepID=UPI003F828D9C
MKKLLYRKLLKDYMSFFLIALISSGLIIWVFQAVNFLDIMIEDGREYTVYINYSLLNFPKILSRLLPFVLFFSIFYVLSKYELNNELIIFWNFGESKLKFINFILLLSIILFFLQIIFTTFIVPYSQDMARSFLRESNVNFLGNFIKPKRFNDTIDGVTIYAENKDVNGHLYNIYIRKDNKEDFEITYAKRGLFDFPSGTPVLILFNGETIKNKNNKITNFKFSKSDFLLKNLQTNTITKQKTQEMRTNDILSCIVFLYELKINFFSKKNNQIVNCREGNKINMLKEFYKRLIVPLYIPVLMLVPYILVFSSKEKINYSKLKIYTFLLGVIIIIISEGIIRFISSDLGNNTIILSSPFILFISLYFVFVYKLIFYNKK